MRVVKLVVAAGAALLLYPSAPATAASGELDKPRVAFTQGFPAEAAAKVNRVLDRKDCKFLGGNWLNSWTSLRYGGNALAANLFMEELAKCPGVTIGVRFRKLANTDCDWRVGHSGLDNQFLIEINLSSSRISVEDVVVPDLKGPAIEK